MKKEELMKKVKSAHFRLLYTQIMRNFDKVVANERKMPNLIQSQADLNYQPPFFNIINNFFNHA